MLNNVMLLSLQGVTEDHYDVKRCVEEAAIIVTNDKDPKTSCTITLTSPIMRENEGGNYNGKIINSLIAFNNFEFWNILVVKRNVQQPHCFQNFKILHQC